MRLNLFKKGSQNQNMKYDFAPDLQKIAEDVCRVLFPHVNIPRIRCFRSYGSSSRRTIARCHSLNKLMQKALDIPPFYPLEFISEHFDKLSKEEQTRVIIHELMHIPKCFGGGFRHHDFVCDETVNNCYKVYCMKKTDNKNPKNNSWF